MISVIVCSRKEPAFDVHERNVAATVGCEHEYVRIDNRDREGGIGRAYNEGVRRAAGDVLVFMHEDAFFMEPLWGPSLERKFSEHADVGLVGVAGTQYLDTEDLRWHSAGKPFVRGRVVHDLPHRDIFALTVFSWDRNDAEVVAVDGLFFAVRASLFESISFDEERFDGFHFYDLDICMQVREVARCIATWDLLIKHFSEGKNDRSWHEAASRFREKYADRLPASCVEGTPGPGKRDGAENYDLRGKAPRVVIV